MSARRCWMHYKRRARGVPDDQPKQVRTPGSTRATVRKARNWQYRENELAKHYGITVEELRLLRSRARCDVCDRAEPGTRQGWNVDHDHATGAVRGVLCHRCNVHVVPVAEGRRHGRIETVRNVIAQAREYVRNPPGIRRSLELWSREAVAHRAHSLL